MNGGDLTQTIRFMSWSLCEDIASICASAIAYLSFTYFSIFVGDVNIKILVLHVSFGHFVHLFYLFMEPHLSFIVRAKFGWRTHSLFFFFFFFHTD